MFLFYWLSHIKLFSKLQNNPLTLYWMIKNLFIKCHIKYWEFFSKQFSSIVQLCPTLCDPMDCSMPSFPVHHQLPELAQTHIHRVNDAIQPSHPLCHHLLLLPSVFPTIRVFSSKSAFHIRWPMYWSFSFSISPSKKIFGTDFI